jgi:hypothetical protein
MRRCSLILFPAALLILAVSTIAPPRTAAQSQLPLARQASPPSNFSEIKRLILKDGGYQPIVKLEIHGDRVRYLSAERYEWEEVPSSLVDWAATEKYARGKGGQTQVSADVKELDAEEQAERQRQEQLTPLAAPGLRLPATGGVFLLDVFNGQAQLNELTQNGGEVKRNTGGNILRATVNPLSGQKQTIELKGQHARIQSHVPDPLLYAAIDQGSDDSAGPHPQGASKQSLKESRDRFRLIRVESIAKKDVRVVGNIKIAVYGKVRPEEKFVPAKVEVFSGPWVKIIPAGPLEPGEYALVEMLEDNQMNLYVWDFGVNPKAPENPGAYRGTGDRAIR